MCVTDDGYLYYPHEIRVDSEDTLMQTSVCELYMYVNTLFF